MKSNITRYMTFADSTNWQVRAHAARELSSYTRDADARAGLLLLLEDRQPQVRRVAADALMRCATVPGVWPALILAQMDSDTVVRDIAVRALQPPDDGAIEEPARPWWARLLGRRSLHRA